MSKGVYIMSEKIVQTAGRDQLGEFAPLNVIRRDPLAPAPLHRVLTNTCP